MAEDLKSVKPSKDVATQNQNNTINVDDFYTKAGYHFRRKQKFWWICLSFVPFFTPFQMIQIIFIALIPPFNCTVGNLTFANECKEVARDNCTYTSEYPDSLVRKWSSGPCDTVTPMLLQVIFMSGVMTGALSLGAVADRFGRKPVMGGCIFGTIFFAVLCVLVSEYYEIFVTFRFFAGIGTAGAMNSAFCLAGELVGPKYRGILSTSLMGMFALGIVVCSGIAYVIQKSWVLLSLVLGLIPLVLVPVIFVVPESPHWLLAFKNGDKKKGLAVLEKLAGCKAVQDFLDEGKVQEQEPEQTKSTDDDKQPTETTDQDKVETVNDNITAQTEMDSRNIGDGIEKISPSNPTTQIESIGEKRKSKVSFSVKDDSETDAVVVPNGPSISENPVKTKEIPPKGNIDVTASDNVTVLMIFRKKYLLLFIQVLSWFTNSLVYYALTYAAGSNSLGDVYLMNAFNGLVEIPAYIVTAIAIEKCGRRYPTSIFMILAGICLFLVEFALDQNLYVSLLGKLFISGSFCIIFTHTTELFPTTVRNSMLGLCTFFARAAGVAACFFVGVRTESHVYAIIILGSLSLISGGLNLALPETLKKQLPNTLYDMDNNLGLCKCRH